MRSNLSSSSHLSAVHILHGIFSEKEINIVLIFNRANKIRPVELLEIVLLGTNLIPDYQGVTATEVRHGPTIKLAACNIKEQGLIQLTSLALIELCLMLRNQCKV